MIYSPEWAAERYRMARRLQVNAPVPAAFIGAWEELKLLHHNAKLGSPHASLFAKLIQDYPETLAQADPWPASTNGSRSLGTPHESAMAAGKKQPAKV